MKSYFDLAIVDADKAIQLTAAGRIGGTVEYAEGTLAFWQLRHLAAVHRIRPLQSQERRLAFVLGEYLSELAKTLPAPHGYESCAMWGPTAMPAVGPFTNDFADTYDFGMGVCSRLRHEGAGGERLHFPLATWVWPVFEP